MNTPLPAGLDDFFALVGASNPFVDNRVNGPAGDGVDVEDIHRAEFARLTTLAGEARDLRRGVGVVLWGEAGVGKSHLLARLVRWGDQDGRACVIYLHNLQARPENLPRSLLRAVVSILTRGRVRGFHGTPLYELAFALVMEALQFQTTPRRVAWSEVEQSYAKLIDGLSAADPSRAAVVDRTVYDVVYRFMRSVFRLAKTRDESVAVLAVRWLSGDYLDPDEARQLGLPPGRGAAEPVALADEQQIKQVLVALSRMALSRQQPFVLCFDQVDNLDDDQAAALARFLEAVIDSAPNLLVVTAGVQASLLRWRQMKVFQDSAWDRLAQFEVRLERLNPDESRRVVAARLERVVTPFVALEPVRVRVQHDELFPLGRAWADEFFRDRVDLRPRDAINGAREGWRREQERLRQLGGAAWLDERERPLSGNGHVSPKEPTEDEIREAIDRRVVRAVEEYTADRCRRPEILPPDADQLAGLAEALFRQRGGLEIDRPHGRRGPKFPYSLVVRRAPNGDGPSDATGILFLAETSALVTTAALRRLKKARRPPELVLLVTDVRRRLAFGTQAKAKGREFYEELCQRGRDRFRHVELTVPDHALLAALQAVVGMARSGELDVEIGPGRTRQVSEPEVIESHRRRGVFQTAPVLREVCGGKEPRTE